MSDQSAAPPPPATKGGGGPIADITRWAKKNKLMAGAVVAGGAVIFLTQKGKGADAGSEADTYGQIVPVMTPMSEGDDTTGYGNDGEPGYTPEAPYTPEPPDTPEPAESGTDTADPTPAAPPGEPAASPPAAGGVASGVTVRGRFFAGASNFIQGRAGSDANGAYRAYTIVYPGRQEQWRIYTTGRSAGKWVGPIKSGTTQPKSPVAPKPAPKPAAPKPASPAAKPAPKPNLVGTVTGKGTAGGIPNAMPAPSRTSLRRGWEYYSSGGNCRKRRIRQWSDGTFDRWEDQLDHKGACKQPGIRWD